MNNKDNNFGKRFEELKEYYKSYGKFKPMENESDLESFLVECCNFMGWKCYKNSPYNNPGIPDRLIITDLDQVAYVELKNPKGTGILKSNQKDYIQTLKGKGRYVKVIDNPHSIFKLLETINDLPVCNDFKAWKLKEKYESPDDYVFFQIMDGFSLSKKMKIDDLNYKSNFTEPIDFIENPVDVFLDEEFNSENAEEKLKQRWGLFLTELGADFEINPKPIKLTKNIYYQADFKINNMDGRVSTPLYISVFKNIPKSKEHLFKYFGNITCFGREHILNVCSNECITCEECQKIPPLLILNKIYEYADIYDWDGDWYNSFSTVDGDWYPGLLMADKNGFIHMTHNQMDEYYDLDFERTEKAIRKAREPLNNFR